MLDGKYTIKTNCEFLGQDIKVTAVCLLDVAFSGDSEQWGYSCEAVELFFGESAGMDYEWRQLAPEVQVVILAQLKDKHYTQFGITEAMAENEREWLASEGETFEAYGPDGQMHNYRMAG